MKRGTGFTVLLGMAASLGAQQLTLGSASKSPGQTAGLSVQLSTGGAQIAGVQFDLIYDKNTFAVTAGTGSAAGAAGKGASTSGLPNGLRVIIVGFNQNTISTGDVADLSIQIAASATAATYPLAFNNVSATDPNGHLVALGSSDGSVTVLAPLAITGPGSLSAATVGTAYAASATATGGVVPYTWSATGLPGGLSMNGSGSITGAPSANTNGSYNNVQVTVKDSVSTTASQTYSLTVDPAVTIAPSTLPAAMVNAPYTAAVTATGGSGSYTWSAPVLPGWMSFNAATGALTGTPTTTSGSPLSVQVKATDSNAATASQTYSLTVEAALGVSPSTLPVATVNAPYAATVTATGGSGSYTLSAPVLPGWMSFNAGTGALTGTPATSNGSPFSVQVKVTDSNSATATQNYAVTVDPALTISPATLPPATVSVPYTAAVTATGGSGNYTLSAPVLPGWMSFNAGTGALTGTPTTTNGSPFSVQVKVTDSNAATASRTFSLAVEGALAISPSTLPAAMVNAAYSLTFSATGGSGGGYTWSATGLPAGLSMNASGAVTGAPAAGANGSYNNLQVTVTDSNSTSVTRTYSLTVEAALTIAPSTPPAATVNTAYSLTFSATGGNGGYTWSATGLPAGLSMNAGGTVTGVPAANSNGSYNNVQVTVTDSNSARASQTYSLTVNPALAISSPAALPQGVIDVAYPATAVTATGGSGTGTYTWSASGLPSGMGIAPNTGSISGTPATNVGSPFSVAVTVTDANSSTANRTYSLVVNGPLAVSTPAALAAATVGAAYTATATGTGGTGPYRWSASGLPAGLAMGASTGTIAGTPAIAGNSFSVQVSVTDSTSTTATRVYTLTVNAAPVIAAPASLAAGTVSVGYPATAMTATGGTAPLAWSATGLPAGLSIDPGAGVIAGTPANAGSAFNVVVTATDANSATAIRSYTLTVNAALLVSAPASLPLGVIGVPYPVTTAAATGGSGVYLWSAAGLPAGLAIGNATGAITGTPAANAGSPFSVLLTVTDSNSVKANRAYALSVNSPLSISGPASLPVGTVNSAYPLTTVTATGGTGVYTWSVTGLPGGMGIGAATGAISGTPATNAGSPFNVQVTVTDGNFSTANRVFALTIGALPLTITAPSSLPAGILNAAYPATSISAQGGSGNYGWSATGLPPGMSIDPGSGTITGTPIAIAGSPYTVQVTVTDGSSATASRSYSLTISGVLTVAAPSSLPAGTAGVAYAGATVTAGGGVPPYTWAAAGLPAGLSMGFTTGIIGGTPTTSTGNPFTVKVTVTDSTGATANRGYSLTVNSPLSVSGPASLPAGTVNVPYPATTPTADGANGVCSWTATGLPPGLTMDSGSGTITGTPTSNIGSPYNVAIWVQDSTGTTATRTYSLTVNPGVTTVPATAGVSNAAGGQIVVAPNAWVSVYGSNLVPAGFTGDWSKAIIDGKLPTTLDGVSVTVGGQAAFVSYVSPGQVNALLPNVGFGPLPVTVTTPAGTSTPFIVNSQQFSPAFFPWPNSQPVATHLDYTLAAKNGTFDGTPTVPAKAGEVIVLWCTGFGPTNPTAPTGVPIPVTTTYNTASAATVMIGNVPATVFGTALAPGFAGLYQMALTVPASLPDGDYTLIANINGAQTPATTLTVQN